MKRRKMGRRERTERRRKRRKKKKQRQQLTYKEIKFNLHCNIFWCFVNIRPRAMWKDFCALFVFRDIFRS